MNRYARDIILFVGLAGITPHHHAALVLVTILLFLSLVHTTYTNIFCCSLFSFGSLILELAFDRHSPRPGMVVDQFEFMSYFGWHMIVYCIIMLVVFCVSWADGARSYIKDRVIVVSFACLCVNWLEFIFARKTPDDIYMVAINLIYVLAVYFMFKRMNGERFSIFHLRRSNDSYFFDRTASASGVPPNTPRRRKGEKR